MNASRPISKPPARLRQRQRASGEWRIWWEPEAAVRELGFATAELDCKRLTWSRREAERLNREVADARTGAGVGLRRAGGRRTIAALIAAYRQSPRWDGLKPRTQQDYRAAFLRIQDKWGEWQVALFTKPVVLEWYETLYRANGPRMAQSLIGKLSLLMTYAENRGWIEHNPCLRLGMIGGKPRQRIVTWEEYDALILAAQDLGLRSVALAIAVAFLQGQRQTDVLAAKKDDFRGEVWRVLRSKRSNLGAFDVHPQLAPMLLEAVSANLDVETLIVSETTGRAYKDDHFRHRFLKVRAHAAKRMPSVADAQYRDLRRSFGHWARVGGASERDVADALGNNAFTDPKLSGTYMPATAVTASRAVHAVQRPEIAKRKDKA